MTTPQINEQEASYAVNIMNRVYQVFAEKIVGQTDLLQSLMIAVFGRGHILLESLPGMAKTTAARTVAEAFSASFQRIQCTPDLLPSDIIGSQILDQKTSEFKTILGPIHANMLLVDEVNRASAKTQSAMLEAMEEKQTTIAGHVYPLPNPFMVLATQNPLDQEGTYPLPEAQIDRFMIKETIDYPSAEEEVEILQRINAGVFNKTAQQHYVATTHDILRIQQISNQVYIAPSLLQYITDIVRATRQPDRILPEETARLIKTGAGPRGSIFLAQAARIVALAESRTYVLPEDIDIVAPKVLNHRIALTYEANANSISGTKIIEEIVRHTPQVR